MNIKSLFLSFALLSGTCANAQTSAITNAEAAIVNLQGLNGSTASMTSFLGGISFYVPMLVTNCSYCSYAWGSLCWKHSSAEYAWTMAPVQGYVSALQSSDGQLTNDLSKFNLYYQPLKSWFTTSLPEVNTNINSITGTNSTLLASKIQVAISQVSQLKTQLNTAISSLDSWSGMVSNDITGVNNSAQNLKSFLSSDYNSLSNYAAGLECGGSTLTSQYSAMSSIINSRVNSLLTTLTNGGITTSNINSDLAIILGSLVNIQTQLNGIDDALTEGQITTSAAIQKIKIIIAQAEWQQLISFAQNKFQ